MRDKLDELLAMTALSIHRVPPSVPVLASIFRVIQRIWHRLGFNQAFINYAIADALRHQYDDHQRQVQELTQRLNEQAAQLDDAKAICRQLQEEMHLYHKMLDSDLEVIVRHIHSDKP